MSDGHPETSDDRDEARNKDGSSAAGVLVEDGTGPATDEGRAEVGRSIEETTHPGLIFPDVEFVKVKDLSTYELLVIRSKVSFDVPGHR